MANSQHPAAGTPDPRLAQALMAGLTAAAERRWGAERTIELANAIAAAAATLAQVAAVELELDDEPDFIR